MLLPLAHTGENLPSISLSSTKDGYVRSLSSGATGCPRLGELLCSYDIPVTLSCYMQEQDDAEVAALADEADMPIEQLLAMYGMVVDQDSAPGPGSAGDGAAKEPSEGVRGRSSKRRRLVTGEASL